MTTYDVILPAGGRLKPDFAQKVGTDIKALIEFEGLTILERTLVALHSSGRVRRAIVIGNDALKKVPLDENCTVLPETDSGPGNILAGLKYLLKQPDAPTKVMVATTDLPFLTPELINDFIDACPADKDICVPLVNKKDWEKRFPGSTATFVPLRDGSWTAGCVYLIDVKALEGSMPRIEKVFENRKSVLGMAKLLGPVFLMKFLFKTLTIPDVEAKIVSMLGCSGAAIPNAPVEFAYDIDDFEDYDYAMRTQVNVSK